MGRTEAILLTALMISIAALAISFSHERGIASITGLDSSGTATTSVNLTEEVSVKITGSIDFGSGRVNSTAVNATLDSNLTGAAAVLGGTWNGASLPQYVSIENDGTVNISVNVSGNSDNNAKGLIGGTSPLFQVKGITTKAGACSGTFVTSYDSGNVPNSTETPLSLCALLNFPQSADSFNVSARLVIPNDANPGQRNVTITFSVSKV